MTRVMLVYDAETDAKLAKKVSPSELAEADIVIALNDEGSDGRIIKDRFGKLGDPVKVVS